MSKKCLTALAVCLLLSASTSFAAGHALVQLPKPKQMVSTPLPLTLHDAILLALSRNPSIRSSELGRISEKYALVAAYNEFEPQYSLKSDATFSDNDKATYSVTPTIKWKSPVGTSVDLGYTQQFINSPGHALTLTVTQPLLQGFGRDVTESGLLDSIDAERNNRIAFEADIITDVIGVNTDYRQGC